MLFDYTENYGNQTWIVPILEGIQKRVTDCVKGMTSDRVFASAVDDKVQLDWPPADRFVSLFTPSFPVDQRMVTGGGAVNTAFDTVLVVKGFVRLEQDIEGKSTEWLQQEAFGLYSFALQLLKCLHMWEGPVSEDLSNEDEDLHLLRRPMRISPGFTIDKKKGREDSRWGVVEMKFEVSFVCDLGDPYPNAIP